jgi:type IV secretion system protein VirB1
MDLLGLAMLCGPWVNPATTLRVIDVESGGHAYIIHDNSAHRSIDFRTAGEAAWAAELLIRAGHRIDIGLMQINYDAWLKPLAFPLRSALDPCTNIRLGTTILSANYARVLRELNWGAAPLARALSLYNSGSESRALGYANQVLTPRAAGATSPGYKRVSP